MALIQCKECGGTVSDKAAACPHCGAPVISPKAITCPECGQTFPEGTATCSNCGAPLSAGAGVAAPGTEAAAPQATAAQAAAPAAPAPTAAAAPGAAPAAAPTAAPAAAPAAAPGAAPEAAPSATHPRKGSAPAIPIVLLVLSSLVFLYTFITYFTYNVVQNGRHSYTWYDGDTEYKAYMYLHDGVFRIFEERKTGSSYDGWLDAERIGTRYVENAYFETHHIVFGISAVLLGLSIFLLIKITRKRRAATAPALP